MRLLKQCLSLPEALSDTVISRGYMQRQEKELAYLEPKEALAGAIGEGGQESRQTVEAEAAERLRGKVTSSSCSFVITFDPSPSPDAFLVASSGWLFRDSQPRHGEP